MLGRALIAVFLAVTPFFDTCNAEDLGSCNNSAKDITVESNSTYIQVVECTPPDPAKSFSIRYLWLDATNTAFLLAGYDEKILAQIVGTPAIVLRNPIYDRIAR